MGSCNRDLMHVKTDCGSVPRYSQCLYWAYGVVMLVSESVSALQSKVLLACIYATWYIVVYDYILKFTDFGT